MDQLKMRYQNSIFAHNTEKYNTKFRMYKFGKIYVLLTNDRHVYHDLRYRPIIQLDDSRIILHC